MNNSDRLDLIIAKIVIIVIIVIFTIIAIVVIIALIAIRTIENRSWSWTTLIVWIICTNRC